MTEDATRRTLIVANRTASTPVLLAEVGRRAGAGERFALLVPPEKGSDVHDWTLEDASRLVEQACKSDVECIDSGSDAGATIKALVETERFSAIILSSAPEHHARWLHHDLPHRLQHIGIPVMVIRPERDAPVPVEFPDNWIAEHPLAAPGQYWAGRRGGGRLVARPRRLGALDDRHGRRTTLGLGLAGPAGLHVRGRLRLRLDRQIDVV